MKKLLIIAFASCSLFIACNNAENGKTEDVSGVSAMGVSDKVEALASDTAQYACSCEHKCKTKEDCVKTCGEGCMK